MMEWFWWDSSLISTTNCVSIVPEMTYNVLSGTLSNQLMSVVSIYIPTVDIQKMPILVGFQPLKSSKLLGCIAKNDAEYTIKSKRISACFFAFSSSSHMSYFRNSCSMIPMHRDPILKCAMTPWNWEKLEKQKNMYTMLVASSVLRFQSSRSTRAKAPTVVSVHNIKHWRFGWKNSFK